MTALDLLRALGTEELVSFLWVAVLLDVPRYLLAIVVLAFVPVGRRSVQRSVTGLVSCHNEERSIAACVASMRANGVERVVVVDDGSTDRTHEVAAGLADALVRAPRRVGKPDAMNLGLPHCWSDLVLVSDADTTFAPGSVALAAAHMTAGVGGVGFRLVPANAGESLTTAYQGIEYTVAFAGRRLSDALGILSNVSGAAGLFSRAALEAVGGWDREVAEDAALAMKLRAAGWRLSYAPEAVARTVVPATMTALLLQRLRWDAGIVTIWWRKHPPSRARTFGDMFTSLDVVAFGMFAALALPVYLAWLWGRIGAASLVLLGAAMLALALLDLAIILMARAPPRLLPYVPFYLVARVAVMLPLRVAALLGELVFAMTRFDPYLPRKVT